MRFDPEKHHRRSIRLKDYDYSQEGLYFITICVTDMECFFGSVEKGKMILNDAGKVIEKWYCELVNKFLDVELGDFVVMPNHFHAIIINNGKGNPTNAAIPGTNQRSLVGADLCVRPSDENYDEKAEANLRVQPSDEDAEHVVPNGSILGEHTGSPLHVVVQWFKTMSTNEYIRGVKNYGGL